MEKRTHTLFPAHAGVILMIPPIPSSATSFPRLRGGDPVLRAAVDQPSGLFPAHAGVILDVGQDDALAEAFSPPMRG